MQDYGDDWAHTQYMIDLAIESYKIYWMNRAVELFQSIEGYVMFGILLDQLAVDDLSAFKETMYGYAYYEHILEAGETIADLPQAMADNDMPPETMPTTYDSYDNTFDGNYATPMAALSHYLFGDGEEMNVSIHGVGLSLTPNDVVVEGYRPLEMLAADTSFIGTKSVTVEQFGYDTADSSFISGAYLGNISLKLEGDSHAMLTAVGTLRAM